MGDDANPGQDKSMKMEAADADAQILLQGPRPGHRKHRQQLVNDSQFYHGPTQLSHPEALWSAKTKATINKMAQACWDSSGPDPQPLVEDPSYARIVYKTIAGKHLKLDIWMPEQSSSFPQPVPTLIYIYGGAWAAKAPQLSRPLKVLSKRIAVVMIDYRLTSGKHGVRWPAMGEDLKDGVLWLWEHGQQYGLDTSKFGCWGESAGGHLCSWLATKHVNDTRTQMKVAVDISGPSCVLCFATVGHGRGGPEYELFGFDLVELKEHTGKPDAEFSQKIALVEDSNPITYVGSGTPPFFIAHGDEDGCVPVGHAQMFADALEEAGSSYILRRVQGGQHLFKDWPASIANEALDFVAQALL
eukprot:gnl/TRDRNA2_/TRDRNA2_87268_c0_seq2.p1 gnl/TRDRNA2_/TRDRNA2_87268_c0~~gnl/TRDRNA2_/TRDRNA2_87268_c0_seq2.p1  ORF type:complete len:382 (-),score=32.18 gnl/TRDRNA2_/TRDRNA2_87268_c0_seq2:144-1217(-)